jgi:multiple sugar transport system permease protein
MDGLTKKLYKLIDTEKYAGYILILPNVIFFFIFFVYPFLSVWFYSVTDWDLFSPLKFVGLSNYIKLIFEDDLFRKVLFNTLYYSFVAVPTALFVAYWLALLLNRAIPGVVFFRTIYFLPNITLMVAAAIVFSWIYQPQYGLINYILQKIGINGPNWLNDERWAMPAVIILENWHALGYPTLIFLASFQGIPSELYEAARIDGANWWYQLRYVTFPLSTPAIFFTLTTSLIGAMQTFDSFFVLTRGGPAYATTPISYYIYQNGFEWLKMGYASAVAGVLFIFIMFITLLQWKLRERWVFED